MSIKIGIAYPIMIAILAILKLAGVLGWSWWWVLAPFWIPFVAVAGMNCVRWAARRGRP